MLIVLGPGGGVVVRKSYLVDPNKGVWVCKGLAVSLWKVLLGGSTKNARHFPPTNGSSCAVGRFLIWLTSCGEGVEKDRWKPQNSSL